MTGIAFVNIGGYRRSATADLSRRTYFEPCHLLGMHNICLSNGKSSMVYQAGGERQHQTLREIKNQQPEVLAFSFFEGSKHDLDEAVAILRALPVRPKLIVGGPGAVALLDEKITKRFKALAAPETEAGFDDNLIVCLSEGERLMQAIAPFDFQLLHDEAFSRLGTGVMFSDGAAIIHGTPHVPLAEQIFTRPYKDLSQFNNVGTAKLSSGCNGGCTFCPDGEIVADYRTPEQALEEIQTLAKMGARRIGFASANFPANYQKSSAIARILPPGIGYHYASRIDSQFFAITRNPDSWKRFAFGNHRGLTIDLGEETPLVDRLSPDRLRKYRTREQALQQNERLAAVLKFFRGSNTIFHLFEIPFDWKMTLAEALEHYREVNKFCALHEGQVELSFLGSYQLLTHAIGSPLSNSMSPLDYFRFERDPRALFLALVVRNRARQVEKWYDRGFFSRYGEHDRAMKLNEFAITVGTALLGLSTSQFNLNTVLDALQTKNEIAAEVAFFEQLGSNKGDEIRALSNGAFKKAFPAVTLPATNWVARAVEWLVS